MNIGFSTFVLEGGRSGLSTYILELLRALQQEDHDNAYRILMARSDVDLLSLTNPNFSRTVVSPLLNRPLPNLVWHNTALAARAAQFDLLHIPSARRIPLVKRTRVVATVHDLAAFAVDDKYDRARMIFNRKAVPKMILRADHVIAVSESTRDDLVKYVGYPADRISVIYPGIDHDLYVPAAKAQARKALREALGIEKPFFVYVSRLEHPAKNHIRLIEAFERFKLENDSAHQLVLAGADWRGAEVIRERARVSPVNKEILFPGFVSRKTLPLLYSGCDLMIYPSLYEGFGLPIIEAQACGAPVICSNTSSMRELAGDRMPTFAPADSHAIYECIETAVSKGQSDLDRSRGIDIALRFKWRETARRVMEVYRLVG
jgi:glycosyltransferase involved in cell wall biosynthesis